MESVCVQCTVHRVTLWMKNERIYEQMDAFSQKAIRAEGSRVSERWGFLFLTLRESDLLWGLTPWGMLKHQAVLGYLHFGLRQRPPPLPAQQPHASNLFKIAAGQAKREGMLFLSSPLDQRGCEGHVCAAPWSTEGSWKREKQKNHYRSVWKHRSWTTWVFTTTGLRMASKPKKIWFKL